MNVAVIPARGGSKRIPRKNIKDFCGKPIIAYSIEAAFKSGCFDRILVSTDDFEIAEVAKFYGAEVPFIRPAMISDDYATTMDVICHTINWCDEQGLDVEAACCLYATAPFITALDLNSSYQKLLQEDVDFVFSAVLFSFPVQRAIEINVTGEVSMLHPEYEQTRSQDLPETYHDAGQFYWGKKTAFLDRKSIFSLHSRIELLPRSRVQDIDTPEDWEFAEALFKLNNK
jgi:N-acylneuraminate cytidylyltransferase